MFLAGIIIVVCGIMAFLAFLLVYGDELFNPPMKHFLKKWRKRWEEK